MADLEQMEHDIRAYLEIEKNLKKEDRLIYLMNIAKKHEDLSRMDHLANHGDLRDIIDNAKINYMKTILPMKISKQELTSMEVNYILVLEAFISYLNKNKLLKRLIKFDHTSRS